MYFVNYFYKIFASNIIKNIRTLGLQIYFQFYWIKLLTLIKYRFRYFLILKDYKLLLNLLMLRNKKTVVTGVTVNSSLPSKLFNLLLISIIYPRFELATPRPWGEGEYLPLCYLAVWRLTCYQRNTFFVYNFMNKATLSIFASVTQGTPGSIPESNFVFSDHFTIKKAFQ